MNLGKQLTEEMRALAAGGAQSPVSEVTVGSLRMRVGDLDRYSATLEELTLEATTTAGTDRRAYLSERTAAITRRLSFLEEPLAVWELDGNEGVAQLRSSPPQRDGETVSYWEVQLQTAGQPTATLGRYQWTPGIVERESVPYPATFALLGRIADALEAALNESAE